MTLKEKLYQQCVIFFQLRLQAIQNSITEINESLLSETKSSAGDKHETGRAMLQLEREKAGIQLAEIQKIKETLSKIGIIKTSNRVCLGSIVYTSHAHYFIAISAGEIIVDDVRFYAISTNTPIAKLLINKSVGEEVCFRDQRIRIEKII